jgi:hypothetical protein
MAACPEATNTHVRYELDIRERIVPAEEELKHPRDLMLQGFENSNRRFKEIRTDMN